MNDNLNTRDMSKLCLMLYGIFAGSMLLQFSLQTMALGSVALTIGIFIVYAQKKNAAGGIYESHIHWLIRTFWLGAGLYLPILTLIATAVLYVAIDMTPIRNAIESGQLDNVQKISDTFLEQNMDKIWTVTIALTVPFALWWFYRCWVGYKHLRVREAVPKVTRWL